MNHFDPEKKSDGKRQIASNYYPLIGPYDSGDRNVLEYHLLLMKLSGIDGVIVDWYGRTNYRDYGKLHHHTYLLLQQCERLKMKFVICYEDHTIPILVDGKRIKAADRVTHAISEIQWLEKYWFKSPAYVRLDNKPVLLSFGHDGLTDNEWKSCLDKLGFPVAYFSQDYRRQGAVGGFGWPAPKVGMQQVDRFLKESANWTQAIPAAFPRFNDIYQQAKVSQGFQKLADNTGETFRSTLDKALSSKPAIVQVATWNDWGEGTQIEPSREFGYRDLELVQSIRRKFIGQSFKFTAQDLRMPYAILKLRGESQTKTKHLDKLVEDIVAGKVKESRTKILAP